MLIRKIHPFITTLVCVMYAVNATRNTGCIIVIRIEASIWTPYSYGATHQLVTAKESRTGEQFFYSDTVSVSNFTNFHLSRTNSN